MTNIQACSTDRVKYLKSNLQVAPEKKSLNAAGISNQFSYFMKFIGKLVYQVVRAVGV